MGRSKKKGGAKDIQQQLQEMKLRHQQAVEAVVRAQQDMEDKVDETEPLRREIEEMEEAKERAGAEADMSLKAATGDECAAQLAENLERE